MAITRNKIERADEVQSTAIKKTDTYDTQRRSMKIREAEQDFAKTGDLAKSQEKIEQVKDRQLGGSIAKFNAEGTQRNLQEGDLSNRITSAQQDYTENASKEYADKLEQTIKSGYGLFAEGTEQGTQLRKAIRSVKVSEFNRIITDAEFDWNNDPDAHHDDYKNTLSKALDYFGNDTVEGVAIREKLRGADEKKLVNGVRNAMEDYDDDPANFKAMQDAQKQLIDFYGSSDSGFYAREALGEMSEMEQGRLDNQATVKFQTGAIGYPEYSSYLQANMSKFADGSDEYMKYYAASEQLTFDHNLDQIMRQQFEMPMGQVQTNLKSMQAGYEAGSTAYNGIQNQIDAMEKNIRYDAYVDYVNTIQEDRQEDINKYESKILKYQLKYEEGEISSSKYRKKMEKYNNKIDWLSNPNNLPRFELYSTY